MAMATVLEKGPNWLTLDTSNHVRVKLKSIERQPNDVYVTAQLEPYSGSFWWDPETFRQIADALEAFEPPLSVELPEGTWLPDETPSSDR
jgi:hypothetical protein